MNAGDRVAALIAAAGDGPVFVHSDPFRAAKLVDRVRDRVAYLDAHLSVLLDAAGDRQLFVPAFNYDFPRTGVFDVTESASQLGPLPERFRVTRADWRTPVPIFSAAGTGADPGIVWGDETDPFGDASLFAQLVSGDGVILYYGDTFHYNTIVHYAERLSGGPVYRYDKLFPGKVIMPDGRGVDGSLRYHVRPLGSGLEYDWRRLLVQAIDAGICRRLEGYPEILAASAGQLCDLWGAAMSRDPFALLDERTRKWVEPAVDEIGRRFVISDFEGPEPVWRPA